MDAMLAVEMDEVGIRPWNELKDLDECMTDYFVTEKAVDFTVYSADIELFGHHKKVTTDDEDSAMSSDEYEIDPETGEKIFRPPPSAASVSLSPPSSNNRWIEEYLSNIESSSSQFPPATTTSSQNEINFTDLPLSLLTQTVDQTDPDWLATFIDLDESSVSAMFTDPALPTPLFESGEDKSNSLSTTSPIYVPLSDEGLFSGSLDDEYSASSSSSSDRHDLHFYPTSQNADGATLVETKLEKLEREENSIPRAMSRRSSARAAVQGQQDEEALLRLEIPLTLDDITMSSTEEYNRHLVRFAHLSTEQIHLIKDIRRRGKNKIAAQNCRKRKAITTDSLSEEVDELKRKKHALEERKRQLQREIHETRSQYEYLHRQVLPNRQLPPAITVK